MVVQIVIALFVAYIALGLLGYAVLAVQKAEHNALYSEKPKVSMLGRLLQALVYGLLLSALIQGVLS